MNTICQVSKIWRNRAVLALVFSFFILISPVLVSASTIASQLDSSTSMDGIIVNNFMRECVVVSSTNDIGTVSVYTDGKGVTPTAHITVQRYTDGSCLTATSTPLVSTSESITTSKQLIEYDYTSLSANLTSIGSIRISVERDGGGFVDPLGSWGNGTTFYYLVTDSGITDTTTRIVSLSPPDDTTVPISSPIDFALEAYINPDDLEGNLGIKVTLHNIDQNSLLSVFSDSDIYLFEGEATTTGQWLYSTSTPLPDGNYRIEASLVRSLLYGAFINPFASVNQTVSHQFIVGTSTWVGNISQKGFTELSDLYDSFNATSTEAQANSCNPINLNFSIIQCSGFLFIPSADALNSSMSSIRDGILNRAPWGYLTRFVSILGSTATTSLPSFTVGVQIDPSTSTTLSFDPADMIAGGASLLGSIEDPRYGKTVQDIFQPLVRLFIGGSIVMIVIQDLMSIQHEQTPSGKEETQGTRYTKIKRRKTK